MKAGDTSESVQKDARDIDLGRAAVTEQRVPHGRDISALEEEMGRMGKAMATIRTSLGQQEDEWRAAIGDFHKKAAQERSEISELKEVLANREGKQEKLQDTVARQADEVAETIRRNSELGGRVQQMEEENRLVRKSSAGLKDHVAWVEAGQQSEVARLQETITAGGSKVKEDLSNVQGELAKMKEEIKAMKRKPNPSTQIAPPAADAIVPPPQKAVSPARKCSSIPPPPPKPAKQFPPSVKKGMYFDAPDGIIAPACQAISVS
jgi:chromosome segregation ATPase